MPKFYSGEFRHLFYISNSQEVYVESIEVIGGGGDGFAIISFEGSKNYINNITLKKCKATENRRNGLSLINGTNILIEDFIAKNISGTLPSAV